MRITPLAVWARNLDIVNLKIAVDLESRLTHIHRNALEACFLYCVAIKYLLENIDNLSIEQRCLNAYNEARNHANYIK